MKGKMRVFLAVCMMIGAVSFAAEASMEIKPHRVALVVQNHAETGVQIPMLALSDALVARLSGGTFKVVNPYNVVGKTENRTQSGEALPEMSAVGLAEELGAQGAITVAVVSFLDKKIGTPPNSRRFVMRMVINLVEVSTGAAVFGECVEVESPRYKITEDGGTLIDQINKLMYSAADKCAELLEEKAKGWEPKESGGTNPPPPPPLPPEPTKKDLGVVDLRPKPNKLKPPVEVNEDFTIFDFGAMFKSLAKAMFDNARFKENYQETQAAKTNRPIVIIGGVTNKSEAALSQSYGAFLSAMPDTLRTELGDYRVDGDRFFDAKDDDMSKALAERILASDRSPLEDAVLMDVLKRHGSPDFVIVGDIRLFPGPGNGRTCRFHLALHSLYTGKIVWEGLITAIK